MLAPSPCHLKTANPRIPIASLTTGGSESQTASSRKCESGGARTHAFFVMMRIGLSLLMILRVAFFVRRINTQQMQLLSQELSGRFSRFMPIHPGGLD